jgi:hypothetical protein
VSRSHIPIVVFGPSGAPVQGASVKIQKRGSSTNSTVYANDANTATTANPVTTDSLGRAVGWLERGSYQAVITASGMNARTEYFDIVTVDTPVDSLEQQTGQPVTIAGNPSTATPAITVKMVGPKVASISGTITISGNVGSYQLVLPNGFAPSATALIPTVLHRSTAQTPSNTIVARGGTTAFDSGTVSYVSGDKVYINSLYQVV